MDVGTDDLLAIVTPVRDRLKEVNKIMDAHLTHVNRMKIVAERTHALIGRGSIERAEWVQIADDQLESVITCYNDFVIIQTLYADIAEGISKSMGSLK